MTAKTIITAITLLLTGLSAGLFYAWAVSVIPGTKRIGDKAYIETMQAINRAIINPWFLLIFFGALVLLVYNCWQQYKLGIRPVFWFSLCAMLSYALGTFVVTGLGNVPLNNGLDAVQLPELSSEALKQTRLAYEKPWNRLHFIRTLFSMLSFVLLLIAALLDKQA